MKTVKILLATIVLATNLLSSGYSLEVFHGFVYNMKEDLVIHQNGQEDIIIDNANLKTKPQAPPPYYGFRVSKWSGAAAFEFEFIHQKLYLDDLPSDVQKFEITDGFNLFLLNKAFKDEDINMVYRFGGGLAVIHPDITVRDKSSLKRGSSLITSGEGYHLSGYVLQTSVQKILNLSKEWYLTAELKATFSRVAVPIAEGDVNLQNRALHLDFGVGYSF